MYLIFNLDSFWDTPQRKYCKWFGVGGAFSTHSPAIMSRTPSEVQRRRKRRQQSREAARLARNTASALPENRPQSTRGENPLRSPRDTTADSGVVVDLPPFAVADPMVVHNHLHFPNVGVNAPQSARPATMTAGTAGTAAMTTATDDPDPSFLRENRYGKLEKYIKFLGNKYPWRNQPFLEASDRLLMEELDVGQLSELSDAQYRSMHIPLGIALRLRGDCQNV